MNNQIVIIFLHGLGGNAWFRRGYCRKLLKLLSPNVRFILPQAPAAVFNLRRWPLFIPTWYNIKSLEELAEGKNDYGLLDSLTEIEKLIALEVAKGIPSQNIFLIGFSQGGSLALSLTVTTRYKLGGVVGLGTFLPYPNLIMARQSWVNKSTPILLLHGEKDRIVPFAKGKLSAEILMLNGYNVEEFKICQSLGHFGILTKKKKSSLFLK